MGRHSLTNCNGRPTSRRGCREAHPRPRVGWGGPGDRQRVVRGGVGGRQVQHENPHTLGASFKQKQIQTLL